VVIVKIDNIYFTMLGRGENYGEGRKLWIYSHVAIKGNANNKV
jgi:hypothetical protein